MLTFSLNKASTLKFSSYKQGIGRFLGPIRDLRGGQYYDSKAGGYYDEGDDDSLAEDFSRRRRQNQQHDSYPQEHRGRRGDVGRGNNDGRNIEMFRNPKQVGATLIAVGTMLTVMGMMLFFEANLMRLGNICFLAGIPFLMGFKRVQGFFLRSDRMQATIITSIGIFLVLFGGKPRLGILCEVFGLMNLFGNMFPLLLAIARRLPIIGDVINGLDGSFKKSNNNKHPDRAL